MPRIIDVIHRLFPDGTSLLHSDSWKEPPFWPPDAFAIAATLVNLSDCYAQPKYSAAGSPNYMFTKAFHADLQRDGLQWQNNLLRPDGIPNLARTSWDCLMENQDAEVAKTAEELNSQPEPRWWDGAMTLLCLADVAASGVGFYDPWRPTLTRMGYFVYRSLALTQKEREAQVEGLPDFRFSLCWMVNWREVVVQPKSRTPQVGCTLRSLTHNLCLLPPVGEIRTSWRYGLLKETPSANTLNESSNEEPLNLLLVPFPFQLDSTSFISNTSEKSPSGRFFDIRQDWLRTNNRRIAPAEFTDFLLGLIKAARKEAKKVHGIVLPEAALDGDMAEHVARLLAKESDLEVFVTGTAQNNPTSLPVNQVRSYLFYKKRVLNKWVQSKHHRWKLDAGQIRRYHLGDALDPESLWWEHIDLKFRECIFYVFRHGASMASLVCEDLARIDPVQTVLRAVGPNLLIVLLMDGPQLERRWPGRYATVLADDPGSAVLTLTSLGMVRRSRMPGEKERREIALWKEPGGEAQELSLPDGCHGLLATLSQSWKTNYTLDGRPDGPIDEGGTMHLSLTAIRGVAHTDPRAWVDDKRRTW